MSKNSRSEKKELVRKYTKLHEGVPPKRIVKEPVPEAPKSLVDLGKLSAVEYEKRVPCRDKKKKVCEHTYRHAFDPKAQADLAHDEKGRLHVLGGKYTTTSHGIEDRVKKKTLKSSTEKKVMRANPEHKKDKKRESSGSSERFIRDVAYGGAAAVIGVGTASWLLNRADLAHDSRGAILAGGGVFGGLFLSKKHPKAAMGIAIGGLAIGVMEMFRGVRARSASAQLGASPATRGALRPGQDPWATLMSGTSLNTGSGT